MTEWNKITFGALVFRIEYKSVSNLLIFIKVRCNVFQRSHSEENTHSTSQMSTLLFWVVMPCGLVRRYRRFGETCCPIFRASALKMEIACLSETSASTSKSTWHQNPDQHHQILHRHVILILRTFHGKFVGRNSFNVCVCVWVLWTAQRANTFCHDLHFLQSFVSAYSSYHQKKKEQGLTL